MNGYAYIFGGKQKISYYFSNERNLDGYYAGTQDYMRDTKLMCLKEDQNIILFDGRELDVLSNTYQTVDGYFFYNPYKVYLKDLNRFENCSGPVEKDLSVTGPRLHIENDKVVFTSDPVDDLIVLTYTYPCLIRVGDKGIVLERKTYKIPIPDTDDFEVDFEQHFVLREGETLRVAFTKRNRPPPLESRDLYDTYAKQISLDGKVSLIDCDLDKFRRINQEDVDTCGSDPTQYVTFSFYDYNVFSGHYLVTNGVLVYVFQDPAICRNGGGFLEFGGNPLKKGERVFIMNPGLEEKNFPIWAYTSFDGSAQHQPFTGSINSMKVVPSKFDKNRVIDRTNLSSRKPPLPEYCVVYSKGRFYESEDCGGEDTLMKKIKLNDKAIRSAVSEQLSTAGFLHPVFEEIAGQMQGDTIVFVHGFENMKHVTVSLNTGDFDHNGYIEKGVSFSMRSGRDFDLIIEDKKVSRDGVSYRVHLRASENGRFTYGGIFWIKLNPKWKLPTEALKLESFYVDGDTDTDNDTELEVKALFNTKPYLFSFLDLRLAKYYMNYHFQ